jgi:uncharacterized membrane protein YuzA (DUF378 family)
MNALAYVLVIIGALNWGLVGASNGGIDLVQMLIGSWSSLVAQIVYILVGLSGLWLIFAKKGKKSAPAPAAPAGDTQM